MNNKNEVINKEALIYIIECLIHSIRRLSKDPRTSEDTQEIVKACIEDINNKIVDL